MAKPVFGVYQSNETTENSSHQTGNGKSIENTFPPNRKCKPNMVKVLISDTGKQKNTITGIDQI